MANTALFTDTLSCPKLYLSGKHGKAVAVFSIVQQEPESRNIFKQLEIICSVLQMYVVFHMQRKTIQDGFVWYCCC